jgi:hypothetical protein
MKKSEFVEVLKELITNELNEMNVTGAIGAYQTPFAFTKGKKDNRAVKTMKGFGYTKAERPKRPSSTKLVDYRQ